MGADRDGRMRSDLIRAPSGPAPAALFALVGRSRLGFGLVVSGVAGSGQRPAGPERPVSSLPRLPFPSLRAKDIAVRRRARI